MADRTPIDHDHPRSRFRWSLVSIAWTIFAILLATVIAAVITRAILMERYQAELAQVRAEIKAAGLPTTIEEIIPKPVPEAEDAAPLWYQVFGIMTAGTFSTAKRARITTAKSIEAMLEDSYDTADKSNKRSRKDLPTPEEAVLFLARQDAVSELWSLAAEASRRPYCRFQREWSAGAYARMPELTHMLSLGKLLIWRAHCQFALNQDEAALQTLAILAGAARHFRQGPLTTSSLIGRGLDGMVVGEIQRILAIRLMRIPSEARASVLPLVDNRENLVLMCDGERILSGGWLFEQLENGKADLSDVVKMSDMLGGGSAGSWWNTAVWWVRDSWFGTPFIVHDHAAFLTMMTQSRKEIQETGSWPGVNLDQQSGTSVSTSVSHLCCGNGVSPMCLTPVTTVLSSGWNFVTRPDRELLLLDIQCRFSLALTEVAQRDGQYPNDPQVAGIPIPPGLTYTRDGDRAIVGFDADMAKQCSIPPMSLVPETDKAKESQRKRFLWYLAAPNQGRSSP